MTQNILLFVILASLLIGCAQAATPEAPMPTVTEPASEWTVSMTHSGGIMGLSRSIEVGSDGKFTVVDEREDKTVNGELSAEEQSKLDELLTMVKEPAKRSNGMTCADCFVYDLEIHRGSERFAIRVDDTSLSDSGCKPLITHLRELMTAALD